MLVTVCPIYQVTMSPELRHKERNNVLLLIEIMNNDTSHGISNITCSSFMCNGLS